MLTLLAPCWAIVACSDDGNTCVGIGCNDDVGDTTGDEPAPVGAGQTFLGKKVEPTRSVMMVRAKA